MNIIKHKRQGAVIVGKEISMANVRECDLSIFDDYKGLPERLSRTVDLFGDANRAYEALGRTGLMDTFFQVAPSAYEALSTSVEEVRRGLGAVAIRGTCVDIVDDQTAQLTAITLGSVYGEPTRTDRKLSQVAWPIKYDPNVDITPTFSQSLGEAAFHTDTQYYESPEDSFGLFCVTSDEVGKGTNRLISAEDITTGILKKYGNPTLDELSRPFPFRVPSAFTTDVSDSDVEITWAPILDSEKGSVRYRKDTIDSALRVQGVEITASQQQALLALEEVIGMVKTTDYHLQPGNALVVNNHRLLHARTHFDNPERSLYRVRMRDRND